MGTLSIRFPAGGVTKRYGFQQQEPYTTPDALNIWPYQSDTGRMRGGTRPGLASFTSGPTSPVHGAPASWSDSFGTYDGVVVTNTGQAEVLKVTSSGNSWKTTNIAGTGGGVFGSSTVYLDHVFTTGTGQFAKHYKLSTSASLGSLEALDDDGDSTAPQYCKLCTTWGDRLLLGAPKEDEHLLYACAIGDFEDWDYSAVDRSAAWATSGIGGKIDAPLSALIPHSRDILYACGTDRISVLIGNIAAGGQRDSITSSVGVLGPASWCTVPNGSTYFMSRDGLYGLAPGSRGVPEQISRKKMPSEMINISPEDSHTCSLGMDTLNQGIHIYINRGGTRTYWFHDLTNGGFWPMEFSNYKVLAVNVPSLVDGDRSGMLAMGIATHRFDSDNPDQTSGGTDPSEKIKSYYIYGPIPIASPGKEGIVTALNATLSDDSSHVTWELYVGDSPQEAYKKLLGGRPSYNGRDWKINGYNYTYHPRIRGAALYAKVSGSLSDRISMEDLEVEVEEVSRRRVG